MTSRGRCCGWCRADPLPLSVFCLRQQIDRFPAWKGSLFVAALKEKSVRRVPMAGDVPGTQELLFTELGQRMRDVRAGPDGALYLLTDDKQGQVLRVVPR